jgi:hypothetical protein
MSEDRSAEPSPWICHDLSRPVHREVDQLGIAVARELHPVQVLADHVVEDVLALAYDHELARAVRLRRIPSLLGEVIDDLRAVGAERM